MATETRAVDAIKVGDRIRQDFGDVDALAASIEANGGLLQPILIRSDPPLRFVGKDHSQRPEFSTKRLGRKRGPGGGGAQGAMRRLREAMDKGAHS